MFVSVSIGNTIERKDDRINS